MSIDGWSHFHLGINPVPASRPRVPRFGKTYYAKTYARFRREAAEVINDLVWPPSYPLEGAVHLRAEFHVVRPKTTYLAAPRGDVDNYLKSLLDLLNEQAFLDDRQVVNIQASKHWAEQGSIEVWIAGVGTYRKGKRR